MVGTHRSILHLMKLFVNGNKLQRGGQLGVLECKIIRVNKDSGEVTEVEEEIQYPNFQDDEYYFVSLSAMGVYNEERIGSNPQLYHYTNKLERMSIFSCPQAH